MVHNTKWVTHTHLSVFFHLTFGASLYRDIADLNYERNMILSYGVFVLNFTIFNPGTSRTCEAFRRISIILVCFSDAPTFGL